MAKEIAGPMTNELAYQKAIQEENHLIVAWTHNNDLSTHFRRMNEAFIW